eukprot:1140520-Pelagomonas_calceolata.AAC.2
MQRYDTLLEALEGTDPAKPDFCSGGAEERVRAHATNSYTHANPSGSPCTNKGKGKEVMQVRRHCMGTKGDLAWVMVNHQDQGKSSHNDHKNLKHTVREINETMLAVDHQ